ncbi:MAG: PEP-CTERM sorting domain-containing protein [Cyanobacteria bacterium P01_A01_bin.123]
MSALHKLSIAAIGTVMITVGVAQSAQAGQLHNGWNYGIDAFGDGSGGSVYDIQGLAIKESGDNIFIAINANLSLLGNSASGAQDGNIGWGDLFLNFSGDDFQTASQNGDLIGINFAGTNDSGAPEVGVYSDVTAKSVTADNNGYSSLKMYHDYGWGKTNTMGTDYATKQAAFDEFGETSPVLNVIDSGTYEGGLTYLSESEMAAEGLDFDHFNTDGSETLAFSFSRAFVPTGEYVANIFIECANDGVALDGDLQDVPEPSALGGVLLLGMVAGGRRLRRKRAVA